MTTDHFGEPIAARYDADVSESFDPEVLDPAVDLLANLAAGGAALEFGIGTGRIALPLRGRDVPVHGIDLSPAMVERLRAKPGGHRIATTIGNFATTRVDGSFTLVYLVFNTIMNLTSQDEQVQCFRNAAAHLEPGGRFVLEVAVPGLRHLPTGETMRVFERGPGFLGVDEYTDVAAQLLTSHHYRFGGDRSGSFSAPFRFVWPSELDLMAQLAAMTLCDRWSSWRRDPFDGASTSHVSVWEKTAP